MTHRTCFRLAIVCTILTSTPALAGKSIMTGKFRVTDDRIPKVELHDERGCGRDQLEQLYYQVIGPISVDQSGTYQVRDAGATNFSLATLVTFYDTEPDVNDVFTGRIGFSSFEGEVDFQAGQDYWVLVQPFCENWHPLRNNGVWGQYFDGPGTVTGAQTVRNESWWSGRWSDTDDIAETTHPDFFGCPDTYYDVTGPVQFQQAGTYYISTVSGYDDLPMWIGIYEGEYDPDDPQANLVHAWAGGPYEGIETGKDYYFVVQPDCDVLTGPWYFVLWPPETFEINGAVSGAYFNPATAGQGEFLEVYPDITFIFLAWFTWAAPPEGGASMPRTVGDAANRWFTMQGRFTPGDSGADLDVYNSTGGAFNQSAPVDTQKVGTARLEMQSCTRGSLSYNLDSGEEGVTEMVRIANGNVASCERNYAGPGEIHSANAW